jgi:dTDP-4-amino-4,6-dideoxygalactose transaminase
MIPFLEQKKVNYSRIAEILSISNIQNHYTNDGPVKKNLESALHSLLQLNSDKRVLCCSNGTTAIHSIMFLCAAKHNIRNWATPAFTFPSCVVGHEFSVDILDIDADTYTLPLEKTLLSKYDGIILTNLFGSYVNMSEWVKFCKDNNKILIFDNAASPLSMCDDINICNFGDYSFGSLHHTKYLGFGEGGFIVCSKEDYDVLNSITTFGFYGTTREYKKLSSNFKMSDVSAAFILSHIETYDIKQHLQNQISLINDVLKFPHVKLFNYKPQTVYNTFPILFDFEVSEDYFNNLGIKVHKYYHPLFPLECATAIYNRIINFPLYADLTDIQIDNICQTINNVKEAK